MKGMKLIKTSKSSTFRVIKASCLNPGGERNWKPPAIHTHPMGLIPNNVISCVILSNLYYLSRSYFFFFYVNVTSITLQLTSDSPMKNLRVNHDSIENYLKITSYMEKHGFFFFFWVQAGTKPLKCH